MDSSLGGVSSKPLEDPITVRILQTVGEIFEVKTSKPSLEKLTMVVGILEAFVNPDRFNSVRRSATKPSNILKVALHLTKKEMKTVNGQNRLATRLLELVRMDGQYVTKEETLDSMIQLLELHNMFSKEIPKERRSRMMRRFVETSV